MFPFLRSHSLPLVNTGICGMFYFKTKFKEITPSIGPYLIWEKNVQNVLEGGLPGGQYLLEQCDFLEH